MKVHYSYYRGSIALHDGDHAYYYRLNVDKDIEVHPDDTFRSLKAWLIGDDDLDSFKGIVELESITLEELQRKLPEVFL